MRKIKNKKSKMKRKLLLLSFVSFLTGFQMAVCLYILSAFLQERAGVEDVGIFYFIAYSGGIFVLLNLHDLFRVYGKSKVALITFGFKAIALFLMAVFYQSPFVVVFVVLSLMSGSLMWASLDVLIEHFSDDKITGSIRGAYLTIMNAAIMIAPFIASFLIDRFNYSAVFYLALLVTLIAIFIISKEFSGLDSGIKKQMKFSLIFNKMKRRKNLSRIYYISFLLDLFYAVMVIYTPIYLIDQGLSFLDIGKVLMVALVPFVILQYPLGVIADKKLGEKELLVFGILLMAIFSGLISFLNFDEAFPWMVVLFGTRIGASIVEVMRDAYFYKKIGPQDIDLIDFFRTTRSLSYIIGTVIFSVLMIFTSLNWIFLFLGLIILTGLIPLIKLEDTL